MIMRVEVSVMVGWWLRWRHGRAGGNAWMVGWMDRWMDGWMDG